MDTHCLELDLEPCELWPSREPGPRGTRHATHLLGIDHLQGMPEADTAFLLDLDHEQPGPSSQDEVELVPSRPGVRLEQPIATKSIVTKGAALAAIHAAS